MQLLALYYLIRKIESWANIFTVSIRLPRQQILLDHINMGEIRTMMLVETCGLVGLGVMQGWVIHIRTLLVPTLILSTSPPSTPSTPARSLEQTPHTFNSSL